MIDEIIVLPFFFPTNPLTTTHKNNYSYKTRTEQPIRDLPLTTIVQASCTVEMFVVEKGHEWKRNWGNKREIDWDQRVSEKESEWVSESVRVC